MTPQVLAGILANILPDVKLISISGVDVKIDSEASSKQIFDAERELRKQTGIKYELFMERQQDQNKLRIRLATFRGVKT